MPARRVFVTGAAGYIGRQLVAALATDRSGIDLLVASDVRPVAAADRLAGVEYQERDVRDSGLGEILSGRHVDTVVHLASIVTPGPESNRELEYTVDVLGTRNVLEACLHAGVRRLIVTSSGAAYGYHRDAPQWLHENDPLRGNDTFAYSRHKRLVEEMLAEYRHSHPELEQIVFRPGTVLGPSVANQIVALFDKPLVIGVAGSRVPFVFIWDRDVVACLVRAIRGGRPGVYNLAGDGVVPLRDIARRLGKRYLPLPAWLLRGALSVLRHLGRTQYGPEQVDFLRYRPVLANDRLKNEFGYTPMRTSAEVFEDYCRSRDRG